MSKRKPRKTSKKEVFQPDDKLFKEVMEKKENAIEYVVTNHAALAKKLDLTSFKIEREKLSIPNFKIFEADIIYSCKFKNSEETLNISLLWENKSQPEEFVIVQVGLYLFLRYYKMVKAKELKFEPIIPLIFYNGKTDWEPKTFQAFFRDHPSLSVFKKFLPDYDFLFTNITKVPLKELLKLKNAFFRSSMIAMGLKHNRDLLLQKFPIIFDLDEEDERLSIGYFILSIYERAPEDFKEDISQFAKKIQINIMSTLSMFIEEGKKEAVKEAVKEATREAKKAKEIEIIQRMHKNGISLTQISTILGRDEKFILAAIQPKKK